jgi:hypothetical protein
VSLLSRKAPVSDYSLRDQAMDMARQAVPAARSATTIAAQQAVPVARNAGTSMKAGADGAVAWATPYANAARTWAAPQLEQAAIAISEKIAPMVSEALISAAHKIDVEQPKRRRLSKPVVLAGSLVLTAAGAAAAMSLLNRNGNGNGYTAQPVSDAGEDLGRGHSGDGYYEEAGPGTPDAGPDDPSSIT